MSLPSALPPSMHQPIGGTTINPQGGFRPAVVLLVGPPGSGKSTFSEDLMRRVPGCWERINQVCGASWSCLDTFLTAIPPLHPGKPPSRSQACTSYAWLP